MLVCSSMWFVDCVSGSGLDKLVSSLSNLKARLDSRKKVSPAVFSENMKLREETHHLGMTALSLLLMSDSEGTIPKETLPTL